MSGHGAPPLSGRLGEVVLSGEPLTRLSPALAADRAQAVADLTAENSFTPLGPRASLPDTAAEGPFALYLSIQDGRLIFDIRDAAGRPVSAVALALGPFRRLIKDYQMLVDSHITAMSEGGEARIQAIDMGRRGLHNEAAELLTTRLAGKIAIDFATARRLFTLVCVLHQRI